MANSFKKKEGNQFRVNAAGEKRRMNNKLIVTPHIIMSNNTSPISLCSRLFARPFLIRRGAGNRPRIVMNAFAIQKKEPTVLLAGGNIKRSRPWLIQAPCCCYCCCSHPGILPASTPFWIALCLR